MKIKAFKNWVVESAEKRLMQLGLLDKKDPGEWAQHFIRQAHPDWQITDSAFNPTGCKSRFFVVLGSPDEDVDSTAFDYDWIEVWVYTTQLKFKFSSSKNGDQDHATIIKLPAPMTSSLELGRFIAAQFEEFAAGLEEIRESFDRLKQLNLAPTGNFFDLLAMLVEREHPDWHLITRNIGRQTFIIPEWNAPVQIVFEVDHSYYDEPNEHLTVIQPIDELHRIKLRAIELLSPLGKYSPWDEAKRALSKIEEYVERTESAAMNKK